MSAHTQQRMPSADDRLRALEQNVQILAHNLARLMSNDHERIGVKLSRGAKLPTIAKPGDAAVDVQALAIFDPVSNQTRDFVTSKIPPHGKRIYQTGLRLDIPPGFRVRAHSRSGLSAKHSVEVGAGLIDNGYTGELAIILYNLGDNTMTIDHGDRIAQICLERYTTPVFFEVDTLPETERGTSGYGSTGVGTEKLIGVDHGTDSIAVPSYPPGYLPPAGPMLGEARHADH